MLDQRDVRLLDALFAFFQEHQYCGDLDGGVQGDRRTWLDSWAGIGRIAVGMARQSFDLQFT